MDAELRYAFIGPDLLVAEPPAPGPGAEGLGGGASAPFSLSAEAAARLEIRSLRAFRSEGRRAVALNADHPAGAGPEWAPEGFRRLPARAALAELGFEAAAPLLKALALAGWVETARFCGRCGAALRELPEEDGDSGGMRCPSCGLLVFPRISPAGIVLVRREGRILLAHNRRFAQRRFGLIAGFVEAGETVEDCLRRELREEAGIEVGELRYRYSQPWPFPDSLMLAFAADWASGEARPDGAEIDELGWFGPGELPEIPPPGSVARKLIDDFLAEGGRD